MKNFYRFEFQVSIISYLSIKWCSNHKWLFCLENNNNKWMCWMYWYFLLIVSSCFDGVNIWQSVSVNITLINHHLSLLNDWLELTIISRTISVLISSSSARLDKNLNISTFFNANLYLAVMIVHNTKTQGGSGRAFLSCLLVFLFEKIKPIGIGEHKNAGTIFVAVTWHYTSFHHAGIKIYSQI